MTAHPPPRAMLPHPPQGSAAGSSTTPPPGRTRTARPPHRALPGFRVAGAITLAWLGLVVIVPLIALVLRPWELGLAGVWASATSPRGDPRFC